MEEPDLLELMEAYAIRGYKDWKDNTPNEVQTRARACLKHSIVENDEETKGQIRNLYNEKKMKFMPVPNYRHKGIERCFFISRNVGDYHKPKLIFELFLLVNRENNLAFRFEPADQQGYNHDYAHIQFCKKMTENEIYPKGIPPWIPDSYPAFPLPSSDPLKLFLSMLIAVHGRSDGIEKIFIKIFQDASRPGKIQTYLDTLNGMLND